MKLSCLIVDDEYLAIKVIEEYISRVEDITVINSFTDSTEAFNYLKSNEVDIVFLDIQMPYLSGIDLIKELENPPLVIFTTARHDYAIKAFDMEAMDYLVKPFSLERFSQAVEKVKEFKKRQVPAKEKDYLSIKSDYKVINIPFDEIEYIEGLSEYVKIFVSGKMVITLAALKDLLDELPKDEFVRIHKSYIVAFNQIASYSHQIVKLKNEKELPIGRVFKDDFLTKMS